MNEQEYDEEELETIANKFDDFVVDIMSNNTEVLNILDVSTIILSRLCRYSVEAGYGDQLASVMELAIDSIDKVDIVDINSHNSSHTLQ